MPVDTGLPSATSGTGFVARRYGTHRGLIRHVLAILGHRFGRYRPIAKVNWLKVERLVFVCAGNVCRSPYGHQRALKSTTRVASVGVSTNTGRRAEPQAVAAATRRGLDLSQHRATAIDDFVVRPGDLFLIVEDRHLTPLQAQLRARGVTDISIALLGLWARPQRPLIYDPIHLSDAYFDTCFATIDSAIDRLLAEYRTARPKLFVP